jgi:xanthine dehydrogenase accessory factor
MKQLFDRVLGQLQSGENAVLCSIIASSGSAPRGAGAKMAVFPDGSTVGTVGGGAVEMQSIHDALEVLKTGNSHAHAFCLAPNQVQDLGMVCGGNVTVYFQYLTPERLPLIEEICRLLREDKGSSWLVTILKDEAFWDMGIYDRARGLQFTDAITAEELEPLLQSGGVLKKGNPACYVEPLTVAGSVYIFGGGHVSQALAPLLRTVGFRVVVYDRRPQAARKEVFPDAAEVILGGYEEIADRVTLTADDYVVVMTPGHESDREVLAQVLRTPATYIGCIGSRHKVAKTRELLLAAGIPEKDIDRVHSPIGLPIGGETPAEVALSIAAQLVAHRSGHRGTFRWEE